MGDEERKESMEKALRLHNERAIFSSALLRQLPSEQPAPPAQTCGLDVDVFQAAVTSTQSPPVVMATALTNDSFQRK